MSDTRKMQLVFPSFFEAAGTQKTTAVSHESFVRGREILSPHRISGALNWNRLRKHRRDAWSAVR